MKLNRLIPMALTAIAVAGLGTAPVSGQAVSGNGELLLGFRATGGAGSTKNYVVDLGPVATFLSATTATTITQTGVNTDLSNALFYGSDWHDRTDLFWGVVGANGNFAAIGAETPGTLYATRVNLGGVTPAWARHYDGSQSSSTTVVESARSGFNFGTAATTASTIARTMTTSDANSWSSFQPTASLISFNTWDPTIEGTPSQYLDLFKIVPLASGNPEGPSVFVGRMALLSSGDLLFVPAAALGVNSIQFAAATYSAAEDNAGGLLTVTLNRSGDITGPSSVTVTTANDSAVAGTDYTALSAFAVDFLAGETTKTVDITVANRTGDQGTRSFTVILGGATGGTSIGTQGSTTANITEAASTLQFSATTYDANQEDASVNVTITRTGGSSAVTVQLSTEDGGAVAGADYTAITNQVVSIPSNASSVNVIITLSKPTAEQDDKDFFVHLTTPGSGASLNADVDTTTSLVTIHASDATAPVIAFSAPADKAVVTGTLGGSITVSGTATDNNVLAKVEVSVDGGTTWTLATGAPTWTASVQPAGGATTILARATDSRDNATTISRSITYKITGSLTVTVVDVGGTGSTVTGALVGSAAYEVGKSYTLTAKPGANRAFDNWSVPGSTGASVFTFVYTQALVNGTITATFVANPFLPAANLAGAYNGLITAHAGTVASNSTNGLINVNVTAGTGAFTGTVKIDGAILTIIKGVFDNSGAAKFDVARNSTATIARVGKTPYVLAMNLSLSGTHQVIGTLKVAGRSGFAAQSDFTADQAVTTAPALALNQGTKGYFTAVLPARSAATASLAGLTLTNSEFPQGDGYTTISVTAKGAATFATVLADGTAFTAAGALSSTNKAILFGQLYANKAGSFGGEVTFAKPAAFTTVASTDMFWFRPYQAVQHYPYGWPEGLETDLVGTEYSVPVGASVVPGLGAFSATGNTSLLASDGLLSSTVSKSFNISTLNKVTNLGTPADKSFGVVLASATGVIGGAPTTFFTHSNGIKVPFKAVVVQKGVSAGCYGFFLTTAPKTINGLGQSGGVSISAK